jgi:hypothetical protein
MYGFSEQTKYDNGIYTPTVRTMHSVWPLRRRPLRLRQRSSGRCVAYGSSTVGDNYYAGTTNKVNTLNLGASYDFGPVKLFGEVSKPRTRLTTK